MSAPLPPYPPREDAWRFPPPPVGRRWLWVAIVVSVVATVVTVAAIVVVAVQGSRDFPSMLDDPEVVSRLDESCERMRDEVQAERVDAPTARRVQAIEAQNEAVQQMIDDLRDLPDEVRAGDEPLDDWLDDWQLLVDERSEYATRLASDPSADFRAPRVDDTSVADRIDQVAPECTVPETLLTPDRGIS